MTESRPILILNELIVRDYKNKIVYDERFHLGVNIIRGKNSSGKSTISNFIFYILGGAFDNWTTEANNCKDVTAEVSINDAVFTLRRDIGKSFLVPLQIFWGNYEESKIDNFNWNIYPYRGTENTVSFSNVLFNALNFPEVKSDLDSNITMHQILRLLYVDQETPPQSIFRYENFDPPLTRKTISEILLGIYDDSLYSDRINLRNNEKQLDIKEREYKNLVNVIIHSGGSINKNIIEKDLESAKEQLIAFNKQIQELREINIVKTTKKTETKTEQIKKQLTEYKNKVNNQISLINSYDLEIADSKQFISTLEKRILELDNSILTRHSIGELPLTHCPQCLEELDFNTPEDCCKLCKKTLQGAEKTNAKRLLQEMQLQVKESKKLLEMKESKYFQLQTELPGLVEKMRFLQKALDLSIEDPQSTRDERIDTLLVNIGFMEGKIENLTKNIKIVELIEKLKNEVTELEKGIKNLKLSISEKESEQKNKFTLVIEKIQEITLKILKRDLDRQDEFKRGRYVEVDFLRDTFSLDGGNNFSASSKTYFKNAVLFSIFFTSLEFDFMRYPRFILCDNMEDKGMEKERTQNFQEIITEFSNEYLKKGKEHQIIFTTSMVSDKLDGTEYCVGDYYSTGNKTLKF
ncbi:hypothetical protein [Chryseobacterium sp. Mn2064]|uniref:hypothetical protein n=1 Tax=Chryseobacterium sp. Mn2064 TaxID=3395263 RepID=UPI003BBF8FD2